MFVALRRELYMFGKREKERQRETAFIPFLLESMSGVWNSPISLLLCCWLLPLLPMMPHTIELLYIYDDDVTRTEAFFYCIYFWA